MFGSALRCVIKTNLNQKQICCQLLLPPTKKVRVCVCALSFYFLLSRDPDTQNIESLLLHANFITTYGKVGWKRRSFLIAGIFGTALIILFQLRAGPKRLFAFQNIYVARNEEEQEEIAAHEKIEKDAQQAVADMMRPLRSAAQQVKKSVSNDVRNHGRGQDQMNVIILYPDDWRHDDLQDANPVIKTPTFTQLAKDGIRFTYNAVTTSICWMSRATLFTGQYVSGHESAYLFRPSFASNPGQWNKTWPYLLQQAGYYVGHIGKWQYQDRGYKNKIFNFSSYFEGWIVRDNQGTTEYIADVAKAETIRFLRNRPKDVPFAATVAFYPPKGIAEPGHCQPNYTALYHNINHDEVYDRAMAYSRLPSFLQNNRTEARLRYLYRFERHGNYHNNTVAQYATISHIDHVCGEIVQELHRQGIYDKTVIIVTADNGEFHGRHALADKWYPYQESIRVPLIIKDPRIPPEKRGTTDDSFVLNIDLAETILGAAGLEAPQEMHGRDIADLYVAKPTSTKPWRQEFYYEFPLVNDKIPPSTALVQKKWVSLYDMFAT